ncbi:MAG: hypothetical protein JST06_10870 [Bacteroidetes bacterium]|nr:hypothetical protein [Bacteroidota bacterium]MBS1630356.1 hypothetical protein [Bacteroidota bacterium]
MSIPQLFMLPLCGALAGWLTAAALSFLIFHPEKPLHLFGQKVQGLIPAHREALLAGFAKRITQLIPMEQLSQKLRHPDAIASVLPGIEAHIDTFLKQRLSEKMPALALFLSDEILQTIKATLTEEIASLLPEVAGRFAQGIASPDELERSISTQLAAHAPEQIEAPLRQALNRYSGRIRMTGIGLGLLAGLLMMLIISWI